MAIIQKIFRVTDLPEIKNVSYAKLLIAHERQNYIIDASLIKGRKIISINENKSTEDGGVNTISIKFNDGTQTNLYVYNGSKGERGIEGIEGDKGVTGEDANVSTSRLPKGPDDTIYVYNIVNEYITDPERYKVQDPDSYKKLWSAYRGKKANEVIRNLNETFVTEEEYDLLWNEESIKYIYAQYETDNDNEEVQIFNDDTNPHTVFSKYWTYEESDTATYYVAIYGDIYEKDESGNIVYDADGKPVVVQHDVIVRYDPIVANLWDDIYLGATEGYFPATSAQLDDVQPLYVYDSKEDKYVEIFISTAMDTEEDKTNYKNKSFDFYSDGMQDYLHTDYTSVSNAWTYEIKPENVVPYKKPLYTYNLEVEGTPVMNADGTEELIYPVIPVDDDVTVDTVETSLTYFEDAEGTKKITDVKDYLTFTETRYYVKDNGKWKEVTEDDVDTDNFEEYITLHTDRSTATYTFTRHYPVTKRKVTSYETVTEVYSNGNVQLYAKFDQRKYFTGTVVPVTNEDGTTSFLTQYTEILIPSWIVAEFTTNYEDENTLILNTNVEIPGEEDNTEIDTTAEDYEEDDDTVYVAPKFLAYTGMETLYRKSGEYYSEVAIEDIDFEQTYYTIDGVFTKVTGERALELYAQNVQLYTKYNEDTYILNNAAVTTEKEYYIWEETHKLIEDVASFVTNQYITITMGIPVQLPVIPVPLDSNEGHVTVEYDSDVVEMYENGRICAIPDNSENYVDNEIHTDITITPHGGGNPLVFHITVRTPMSSIDASFIPEADIDKFISNEETFNDSVKLICGTKAVLAATAQPLSTSNSNFSIDTDNKLITLANYTLPEELEMPANTTMKLVTAGNTGGKSIIYISSIDGSNKVKACNVEVIKSVNVVEWDEDKLKTPKTGEPIENGAIYVTEDDEQNKVYTITVLKDKEYDIEPLINIEPKDASYKAIKWTSDNRRVNVSVGTKTIEDEPAQTHEATQAEIDDGLEAEVGEIIIDKPAVTHTEPMYSLLGTAVTTSPATITGTLDMKELNGAYGDVTEVDVITLKVNVTQSVERVTVTPSNLTLNIGTRKQLNALLEPETAVRDFTWISQDESIVSVSNDTNTKGVITANNTGTTVITALALDGSDKSASCDVTVTDPITNIMINGNEGGIIYIGTKDSVEINSTLVYTYDDAPHLGVDWRVTDDIVSITSKDDTKCTIKAGETEGSTTLIATAKDGSGAVGAIQIMVITKVTDIKFNSSLDGIVLEVNDQLVLMPEFTPADSTIQILTWQSSNEDVATVNSSGIVTALAVGEAEITARTSDGSAKEATLTITIENNKENYNITL